MSQGSRRQCERKLDTRLSAATAAVVEHLEGRRLFAADIVPVEWQGRTIEARAGEWLVGLERPKAVFDEDGNFISDVPYTRATEAPALQAALDKLDLGARFGKFLGDSYSFLIEAPVEMLHKQIEAALSKLDGFAFVEPNGIVRAAATPNDTNFGDQYGLHNTGQSGGTSDADIDAPEAWDLSTGHTGTVVAVLDSGVNYNHADLAANRWQNPNESAGNGIDDDGNGDIDDVYGMDIVNGDVIPLDDFGHGTEVAGVIAAVGNNTTGVAGVAWNAKILPVKILDASGNGSFADAALGVRYVNILSDVGVNVRVMNASFGGPGGSSTLQQRIEEAEGRGILFVTAAGNNGFDNQSAGWDNDASSSQAVYPSSYTTGNIISVAASTRNDQMATFSNWGATSVDLFAPGQAIRTTDVNGSYGNADGTSFAAPMVAGVAALAFSFHPGAALSQVRDAILNNVDTKAAFSGLVATGGRLNASSTLQAISQGFARIIAGDHQGAKRNDDFYVFRHPTDSTKTQIGRWDSGLGQYVVQTTLTNSVNLKIAVYGLGGNDYFSVGPNVNNPVYFDGGAAADTLKGNHTNDTLIGQAGNDSIEGGAGNDHLTGSADHDILIGNGGNDTMIGVGGNDKFYAADSVYDLLEGGLGTDEIINWDSSLDDDLGIEVYP